MSLARGAVHVGELQSPIALPMVNAGSVGGLLAVRLAGSRSRRASMLGAPWGLRAGLRGAGAWIGWGRGPSRPPGPWTLRSRNLPGAVLDGPLLEWLAS